MTDFTGVERRITLRLLAYWEKLRKDRPMPAEGDINHADLEDLWDSCLLVRVKDLGKGEYVYLGQAIIDAYQSGLSMNDPGRLVPPSSLKVAGNYAEVIESRKPVVEEGSFRNARGDTVKYRQCLLPLGRGRNVEAIFGGMRFRIFPSQ